MLIFTNGIVHFSDVANTKADIDDDGLPIVAKSFNTDVECFIEEMTDTNDGSYDEGRTHVGSYKVSINEGDVDEDFNPHVIKLEHEERGDLGTFTVNRIQHFTITQTYVLWV